MSNTIALQPKIKQHVKFTLAAVHDNNKVTVTLSQLKPWLPGVDVKLLQKGTPISVTLDGPRELLFVVNRAGSTAACNCRPLLMPQMGAPEEALVVDARLMQYVDE